MVCNWGNRPTFITKNRREILDITLTFGNINDSIRDWRVSEEHSFSDYRLIEFSLGVGNNILRAIRNFRNTNWDLYDRLTNLGLSPLTRC